MTTVITQNKNLGFSTDPFSLMALIYLTLASIGAFLSFLSMTSLYLVDGIEWIRVHLITLGTILQFLFGYLPKRVSNDENIATRWDIFALLNLGILTFLYGRYVQITTIMLIGGSILFLANIIFFHQLYSISSVKLDFSNGTIFYLTGLVYFFVGIIMGTGIWLGWAEDLAVLSILEVHIHANNWGLLSFVFAGLFLDKYEDWFGKPLHSAEIYNRIYYLLLFGAFGLVVGPWIGSKVLLVPGLVAHLIAMILIVRSIFLPLRNSIRKNIPALHLISAFIWFFAPVIVAPFVLLGVPGIPNVVVENRAPEALIFGWALQIVLVSLIYFYKTRGYSYSRFDRESLVLFHLGAVLLWISIFSDDLLYALAYLSWSLAIMIVMVRGWKLRRS